MFCLIISTFHFTLELLIADGAGFRVAFRAGFRVAFLTATWWNGQEISINPFPLHGMTFSPLSVIPPQKKWQGYDTFGLFRHTMKDNRNQV
jgi:hypothetical protein